MAGRLPITAQLTNYQRGLSLLDKNVVPVLKFIEEVIENRAPEMSRLSDAEKVNLKRWACELVVKKAFPDKVEHGGMNGEPHPIVAAFQAYAEARNKAKDE